MAFASTAPGVTTTTLTPPSSSHGLQPAWEYDPESNMKDDYYPHAGPNGTTEHMAAGHDNVQYDPYAIDDYPPSKGMHKSSRSRSIPDTKRQTDSSMTGSVDSQWIHRDKLAKIESEELQAAGFVIPKSRAQSRSRRDRSQDKASRRGTDASDHQRSRKNSEHERTPPEVETPAWDLRLPEEIAEDPGEYFISPETGKGTRIPVAKASPAPLPIDYLERDAPFARKASSGTLLDDDASFSLSKGRSRSGSAYALDDGPRMPGGQRSATEGSPKKRAGSGTRKASAPARPPTSSGRPKTRSGPNQRSTSSTRPTTRSGEMTRAPEGDPPWMVSAYQPDPRLPPDQQLLPTVARRLQQEKWEQEGSFGNVYDKDFRPLNDETFGKPPELTRPKEEGQQQEDEQQQHQAEWPLGPEALRPQAKSPTPSRPGTSSYSTMPKIQDKPTASPLTSPRLMQGQSQFQNQNAPTVRVPDAPEEEAPQKSKSKGCGCCLVM